MDRIKDDMNILEILDLNPEMEKVFLAHGMACAGCPGGSMESLREAAEGHCVDLKALLADLNQRLPDTE